MARTANSTATILSDLYDETFARDSCKPFRITWQDLRGIAGVAKLTTGYLRQINYALNDSGYTMIQLDNFLLVTRENDLTHFRLVPPRIVEEHLYDEDEDLFVDEDDDDIEHDDTDEEAGEDEEEDEDCEVDDADVESERKPL